MIPGETWKVPKGMPAMTLVIVSKDGEHVQSGVDPTWNVSVHTTRQAIAGATFISNLRVGNVISSVPCQPEDARFVIRLLDKRRLRHLDAIWSPETLVLTPEGEEDHAIVKQATHWPFRPKRVSVWDLLRHPQL